MLCVVQFLVDEDALKIRWTIVGMLLACAACGSNDDAGEDKGPLASGGGGSSAGGSAGAAGVSSHSNGGAAIACNGNADCVTSAYVSPIESQNDCYCVGCPEVALNAIESDSRSDAWEQFCLAWVPPGTLDGCKQVKCLAPPESVCEAGICKLIN
jgi:hypothetical protein